MASSSSSSHFAPASSSQSYKYDVFLSFRGEDTRKTFVDHLYSALYRHLINVYKDDVTLARGESISQSLLEAIKESQIAIIIFSKNYADSSWCLDELAHIMKCKYEIGLIVIPIFYDVEPTDVRNQTRNFGEAFAKQEAKNVTKSEIWRKALVDASNIAGWEPKNIANGHESQFIEKIVDAISDRLPALSSCVDEDLVGMKARFKDLESLLDIGSAGVRMVGIWGVGGGGKTTLANFVYTKISQHFQSQCIVENVREETNKHGLKKLQGDILSALLKREEKVCSVMEGKEMMKNRLCSSKVLVLLDDVDKLDQLEALAGKHKWFGSGSRIIITTRDEHLLRTHKVDHVYPIKLLSDDEAIRLFKIHAYNEKAPVEDYGILSLQAVSYGSRLPLSLKVLGSFLYDKNKNEWIHALKKLEDIPNPEVMNILKISYDGLEPYEKELFLDIACFWRLEIQYDTMGILEACGFHPGIGIKVLIQKALITIIEDEFGVRFDMHDLVQEMGHYIVRGEHPNNPKKHSKVWKDEEMQELCYGNATMENDTIEAIRFDPNGQLPLCKLVSNMKKLRWLVVHHHEDNDEVPSFLSNELRYIYWSFYPARSLFPDTFLATKLVVLRLRFSDTKELWNCNQHLPHLKVLHLSYMHGLLSTPDFNGLPSLQKLKLHSCAELKEIHPSLGNHTGLEYLYVSSCHKLTRLPTLISQMKTMKDLLIHWHLIPSGIGELSNLIELDLTGCSLGQDFTLSQLTQLKSLNLSSCQMPLELSELPSTLVILRAHDIPSLTLVGDFTRNCEELCQMALTVKDGWSERVLQSMLKGKVIENGSMHLSFDSLEIAKGFTPLLLRGTSCRLDLPENWCNDYSGFLMCAVLPRYNSSFTTVEVSMKQVSGLDSQDDVFWKKSDDDEYTFVWYVSFGSLRYTAWWDHTYNNLSFNIGASLFDIRYGVRGFGVRLVNKKNKSGLTATSTDSSSHYMPKVYIKHDSAAKLMVKLVPYERKYAEF